MSNVRNIHFEAVGSYLRPAELKEARAKFADGKISATDLRSIEDRLITEVIKQQKAHRLPYITDGESAAAIGISTLCGDSMVWNISNWSMATSFMARRQPRVLSN